MNNRHIHPIFTAAALLGGFPFGIPLQPPVRKKPEEDSVSVDINSEEFDPTNNIDDRNEVISQVTRDEALYKHLTLGFRYGINSSEGMNRAIARMDTSNTPFPFRYSKPYTRPSTKTDAQKKQSKAKRKQRRKGQRNSRR